MSIEEVRAAYDAAFGDYSKLSLYLSAPVGKIVLASLLVFIISFIFVAILEINNGKRLFLKLIFCYLAASSFVVLFFFTMSFIFSTKDEIFAQQPSYNEYLDDYVYPYLFSLPEKRYDNLTMKKIEGGELYLTNLEENQSIKVENKFLVDSLQYVLIKDGESSYISERVLEDNLGGKFEVGHKLQIAYITEADRKIIEEHLDDEINILQKEME